MGSTGRHDSLEPIVSQSYVDGVIFRIGPDPVISLLFTLARLVLAALALRGARWAYLAFVALGLAYFPAHVGFHLQPRACEMAFDLQRAASALTKLPHIVLFAVFFVFSSAQTGVRPSDRTVLLFSSAATLVMGALVELAEGWTGAGNCRLRDLLPDSLGILIGAAALVLYRRIRGTVTLNPFVGLQSRKSVGERR